MTQHNSGTHELDYLGQIRLRPAMFTGFRNVIGLTNTLEYLFEELLTDGTMGPCFEIELFDEYRLKIVLFNINLEKFHSKLLTVHLNTKTSGPREFSLGLAIMMALNSNITIIINDSKNTTTLSGKYGVNEIRTSKKNTAEENVIIDYYIDTTTLSDCILDFDILRDFLQQFAFLNPTVKIILEDKRLGEHQKNVYHYPTGIFKQLDIHLLKHLYRPPLLKVYIEKDTGVYTYRIGICYGTLWPERPLIKSFAGNSETYMGGSLLNGVIAGIQKTMKQLAYVSKLDIVISRKMVLEDLNLITTITGEDIIFEGSTKVKLGMPDVYKEVKAIVFDELTAHLTSNPDVKNEVLNKLKREL